MSNVLVVNAGSSSLKYKVVDADSGDEFASGLIERIGQARSHAKHKNAAGGVAERDLYIGDHGQAFDWVLQQFEAVGPALSELDLVAVGHRVVQGGARFDEATIITDKVVRQIEELSPLAPLHNPAHVLGIHSAKEAFPDLPHVAIFDTAFHRTMPPAAYVYPIQQSVATEHRVRKYGFHGTSHQFVSRRVAELLERPLEEVNTIVLHLGNGASACAVQGGESIETSMGMTPLAGLMMGTRAGDVDPSVLIHLGRNAGMSIDDLDAMLNKRSGLMGLAGSNDLRDVRAAAAAGVPAAKDALAVYVHRVRGTVGAYMAYLGRVDAIAFTAGVGENSVETRAESLAGLEPLGIEIDPVRNVGEGMPAERRISTDASRIQVWVVPTNEELEIARQTAAVVQGRQAR